MSRCLLMVSTREDNKEIRNRAWISFKINIPTLMKQRQQDKTPQVQKILYCLELRVPTKKFNSIFKSHSRSSKRKQLKVTTVKLLQLLMFQCLQINKFLLLVTKYLATSIKEVRMLSLSICIMTNGLDSKISWNLPNERNSKTDWKNWIRLLTVITSMRVR